MFPFVFEWQWNAGHLLFLGLFFLALGIIGFGLTIALAKTVLQLFGFMRERHF